MIIRLITALLLCTTQAEVLDAPLRRWMLSLDQPMRRGNGLLAVAPDRLVATTATGQLHVIDTQTGSILDTLDDADSELECTSSAVALDDDVVVYSVFSPAAQESQVVAYNWRLSVVEWQVTIPGEAVGTPLVGENAVYVVHTVSFRGRVSVLVDGTIAAFFPSVDRIDPLGPGTVRTVRGRDVVVVAENRRNGFSSQGNLYMLVQDEDGALEFEWELASSFPRSAVAAPAVSADATAVFLGQQGSLVTGWVGRNDLSDVLRGTANDINPRWGRGLTPNDSSEDARK